MTTTKNKLDYDITQRINLDALHCYTEQGPISINAL